MGLGVCVAVAAVMQVLYVTVGHNQAVYRTGGLFGLGMLWFEGALVAIYGKEWVKIGWVRSAARLWPAALAFVIAWKTALLPPHGLYLISGVAFSLMLLHLIATSPAEVAGRRGAVADGRGDDARPGELPDVPVPRPAADARRVVGHAVGRDLRLAGDVRGAAGAWGSRRGRRSAGCWNGR